MKKTFKCCWNCSNGFTAACQSREETERFRATKRFCCASYPRRTGVVLENSDFLKINFQENASTKILQGLWLE